MQDHASGVEKIRMLRIQSKLTEILFQLFEQWLVDNDFAHQIERLFKILIIYPRDCPQLLCSSYLSHKIPENLMTISNLDTVFFPFTLLSPHQQRPISYLLNILPNNFNDVPFDVQTCQMLPVPGDDVLDCGCFRAECFY